MFSLSRFSSISEVSFHESRDLAVRSKNPHNANINRVFILDGVVDIARLQTSLNELAQRHDALRTRFFRDADGGPFRREVFSSPAVELICADFSACDPEDDTVRRFLRQIGNQGFGAPTYPLVKACVLRTSRHRTVFCLCIAELIADAVSAAVLLKELNGLYAEQLGGSTANLPPLAYRLSDFAASQNAWMASADYASCLERQCDKVCEQIDGGDGIEALLFSPSTDRSFFLHKEYGPSVSEAVFRIAAESGASPASVLMGASALSVAQARGKSGLFFTSSFSNRHLPGCANMVGHLATTVPCYLSARIDEAPLVRMKTIHRELFSSMAQYGLIPIQQLGNEVAKRYLRLPNDVGIKFGKVVIDVLPDDDIELFGLPTVAFPGVLQRSVSNDLKFIFRITRENDVRLWIRGLDQNGNETLAAHIIDELLPRTLALTSTTGVTERAVMS